MILRVNSGLRQCGGIGGAKGDTTFSRRRARNRAGFTLIELLVVIAIIGILAAIIFPVFSTLRENSREANTMSHMHDISAALALYKLDNQKYPPVLFAYACDENASGTQTLGSGAAATETAYKGDGCSTSDTMATIGGDTKAVNELVGLYPEYVKDWHDFTCMNDPVNDPNGTNKTSGASVMGADMQPNYIQANGALEHADGSTVAPYRSYFTADSFDDNPQISQDNQYEAGSYNNLNYVIRYQTAWTSWNNGYDPDSVILSPTSSDPNASIPFTTGSYARQLMWKNPPANTYVTGVTDHVQNADRLLVMYVDGSVHKKNMQLGPWVNGGWDEVGTASTANGQNIRTSAGDIEPATYTGGTVGNGNESATNPNCDYVPAGFWQYDYTK